MKFHFILNSQTACWNWYTRPICWLWSATCCAAGSSVCTSSRTCCMPAYRIARATPDSRAKQFSSQVSKDVRGWKVEETFKSLCHLPWKSRWNSLPKPACVLSDFLALSDTVRNFTFPKNNSWEILWVNFLCVFPPLLLKYLPQENLVLKIELEQPPSRKESLVGCLLPSLCLLPIGLLCFCAELALVWKNLSTSDGILFPVHQCTQESVVSAKTSLSANNTPDWQWFPCGHQKRLVNRDRPAVVPCIFVTKLLKICVCTSCQGAAVVLDSRRHWTSLNEEHASSLPADTRTQVKLPSSSYPVSISFCCVLWWTDQLLRGFTCWAHLPKTPHRASCWWVVIDQSVEQRCILMSNDFTRGQVINGCLAKLGSATAGLPSTHAPHSDKRQLCSWSLPRHTRQTEMPRQLEFRSRFFTVTNTVRLSANIWSNFEIFSEQSKNYKVSFQALDLGCLDSVREFAQKFIYNESRLDILINNAGEKQRRKAWETGQWEIMEV